MTSGSRNGRDLASMVVASMYQGVARGELYRPARRRTRLCDSAPPQANERDRQQDGADTRARQLHHVRIQAAPHEIEDRKTGQDKSRHRRGAKRRRHVFHRSTRHMYAGSASSST